MFCYKYLFYAIVFDVAGNSVDSSSEEKRLAIQTQQVRVEFLPNGNGNWQKSHSTTVAVDVPPNIITNAKYCWTDSPTQPEETEFVNAFSIGDSLRHNGVTGTYYLWVLVANTVCRSKEFNFDSKGPIVDKVTAELAKNDGRKIMLSATGTDNESGIKYFTYTISPTDGIQADKVTGMFRPEEIVEITSTEERIYTISVTATDNCVNVSMPKTSEVEVITGISLAEAKEKVNEENLQEYLGTKIRDYNPSAGGTWRIFYYDGEDDGNGNGYFGPTGTLYLKRDSDSNFFGQTPQKVIASDGRCNIRTVASCLVCSN